MHSHETWNDSWHRQTVYTGPSTGSAAHHTSLHE